MRLSVFVTVLVLLLNAEANRRFGGAGFGAGVGGRPRAAPRPGAPPGTFTWGLDDPYFRGVFGTDDPDTPFFRGDPDNPAAARPKGTSDHDPDGPRRQKDNSDNSDSDRKDQQSYDGEKEHLPVGVEDGNIQGKNSPDGGGFFSVSGFFFILLILLVVLSILCCVWVWTVEKRRERQALMEDQMERMAANEIDKPYGNSVLSLILSAPPRIPKRVEDKIQKERGEASQHCSEWNTNDNSEERKDGEVSRGGWHPPMSVPIRLVDDTMSATGGGEPNEHC